MKKIQILALVLCACFLVGCDDEASMDVMPEPAPQESPEPIKEAPKPQPAKKAPEGMEEFLDMIKKGDPIECVMLDTLDDGSQITVKSWIADKNRKMRSHVQTIEASGDKSNAHVVMLDGVQYMWGNEFPNGMKMQPEKMLEDLEGIEKLMPQIDLPAEEEEDYTQPEVNCVPWEYDEQKFKLPNLEFVDMTSMMKGNLDMVQKQMELSNDLRAGKLPEGITPGMTDEEIEAVMKDSMKDYMNCDICQMIPVGPERTECEAELCS